MTVTCITDAAQGSNNVIWASPSKDSSGSMPIGNGDIGANVWVEPNGDLVFYISKTDAWSENGRLLKIGKVRVITNPALFKVGDSFAQTLDLEKGVILINSASGDKKINLRFWIDANNPVIRLEGESALPVEITAKLELWRNKQRPLIGQEAHSAYGLHGTGGKPIIVEADTIVPGLKSGMVWYHRNERSIWRDNLNLQALGEFADTQSDPLLHLTFGALINATGLERRDGKTLESSHAVKQFNLSVHILSKQTPDILTWQKALEAQVQESDKVNLEQARLDHENWWQSFWQRSSIKVGGSNEAEAVNCAYVLQRYINACGGRGNAPIKFNGSIFTVDGNEKGEWDADYRRWGGGYWWQNTRLPYWSMLYAGDFDQMQSLFKMYRDNLKIRKVATRKYYKHAGAFFPETQYFWGTYVDGNYGRDRSQMPDGLTENRFIRYYWQSSLELSLMMLDYYDLTRDEVFVRETLLPIVSEVLTFYDQHWQLDRNGKILFDPAMALETYREAVNPLPEIVGIRKVCGELLEIPESLTSEVQRQQWQRLISELPDVPTRVSEGETYLAPAQTYSGKQNSENPELYAVFPYRAYGIGKKDLALALRTFDARAFKKTGGWQQNAIKSAMLGLTSEAKKLVLSNCRSTHQGSRFPAFWGPNYDWIPDQCHGSVTMIALQRMLMQCDDNKILLLPAWPKDWDVDFKLHAPDKTVVSASVRQGKVTTLTVEPASRKADVIVIGSKNK